MNNQTFRTGRLLFSVLVTGLVVFATSALGQVVNEDVKLLASDRVQNDDFGESIAIANGVVAVGASSHEDNGSSSGSAYLFDASTGAQIAKLLPSDGAVGDLFGWSIAIANGVVAVGAHLDDDNGLNSGSAYLFDASTGAQIAKLLASDGASVDRFGWSIAIANGVVAVGASYHGDDGIWPGSAYLFDASTGTQIAKLLPSDGTGGEEFGYSIAIANGVVAVGVIYGLDDSGTQTGSAYVFTVPGADCPADINGDGTLNFFDISAFLAAFANGDLVADFNGDGVFNFFDISAFLAAFSAGCP